ncbi:Gfo/Idh/MocA family protein [Dyadobacter sandarakinus]|uniref:Gfo/Idh/MocA family oxidoreductase n=1 Tax=Dyadobacter sandarakinus TaxID=2747268 RepID=A0ABX7I2L4_9BACT|nr:Gfo/Idh/MocA family oxidoreductase [Dyadobacter sandarakinus]QRR00294.1 Gfo/Idh/MocA family oxidoreductase [Dyadobacter sandarakinus]
MEIYTHTKPRLAFAGVGWIGRNRLQAAVDSGLAEIAVVTDPSEECLAEALKLAPASKPTSIFEAALLDPSIDGVVIATPSALHMEQAVMAFDHHKAVFCQKPLGRNASEVAAVVGAAARSGKLLGADFSYRYTAAFQAILPIIESGELGKIFAVDLKFHNAYGPDKPWFYDMSLSGGGCVLDLGIHLIDLMLVGLGFPEVNHVNSHLYSKGTRVTAHEAVEDYANVTMDLSNDVSASLQCSWNLQAGSEAVIEASFYGTNGAVSMKNINGSFYDFEAYRHWGTKSETLVSPPDSWGGRALVHWIEQLASNPEYSIEAEEFLSSAVVLDKIYGRS